MIILLLLIQTIIQIIILSKITDYNIYILKDKMINKYKKIKEKEQDIELKRWLN